MGYTNYWKQNKVEELPEDFINKVNRIFEASRVPLANGMGKKGTLPECNKNMVWFNGVDEESCETFYIGSEEQGFNFCKTNGQPYDVIVKSVLLLAQDFGIVYDVSWDGDESDAEEAKKMLELLK